MREKKSSPILWIVALAGSVFVHTTGASAASQPLWVAAEIGNRPLLSEEVAEYIDAVLIAPELHSLFFLQANGNFATYQTQKAPLVLDTFEEALQRMTIVRVLQAEAIETQGRRYFGMTQKQMDATFNNRVDAALLSYRAEGETLDEAKDAFGATKIKENFPHDSQATNREVFESWAKRLRVRLREDYRQAEAMRYLCSLGNCEHQLPIEVLRSKRSTFERHQFLIVRKSENETLQGPDAYSFILKSDLEFKKQKSPGTLAKVAHYFYLGKLVTDRFEFKHINDYNFLGALGTKLGYPHNDDFGRTSGQALTYKRTGTEGEFEINLFNTLFAERLPPVNGMDQQNVEEETTLRIASRHYTDDNGDQWIILGVSATNRIQEAGIGTWIQQAFHKLNLSDRPRTTVKRDGGENYLQGLFGVGGKYSIVSSQHVDVIITGEALLEPTAGVSSQNSAEFRGALDIPVYGATKDLPIFTAGLFCNLRPRINGTLESEMGAKITAGWTIKRVHYEGGFFLTRWDGELDERYHQGPSWTQSIAVSVTFLAPQEAAGYAFN